MNQKYLELYMKLVELERLLEKDRHSYTRQYGPLSDCAHGQGRIIAYLKLDGTLSVKELAAKLNIRPQSLNDHLNRMIRDGLVVKEQSPEDKRVMLVSLTDKAKSLEVSERDYEAIFTGLDEEEIDTFTGILNKIIENLQEITANSVDEGPVPPPEPKHTPGREPRPLHHGPHPEPLPPHLRGPHHQPGPERECPPHLRGLRPEPEERKTEDFKPPKTDFIEKEWVNDNYELGPKEKEMISEQVLIQFNGLVDSLMQELRNSGLINQEEIREDSVEEQIDDQED